MGINNTENIDGRGRPAMSPEDLDGIVRKLGPYLRTGLSIRKSVLQYNTDHKNEEQVSYVTVYKYYGLNEDFTNKIDAEMLFLSALTTNVFYNLLVKIAKKQSEGEEITKDDMDNLKWYAVTSKVTKKEFGARNEVDIGNADDKPLTLSTPGLDAWLDNLVKKKAEKLLDEKQGRVQENIKADQG